MEKAMASREELERVKRKRRKKDLEEIRRNALAFKRNLRSKAELQKKSNLMKTLNQFSSQRQGIEDVVNSQDSLLNKTKAASEPEHAPMNFKGFFQAGIKGKLITRNSRPQSKLKEAILRGDALQILQSSRLSNKNPNEITELVDSSLDAELKSKLSEILGDSPESDIDENQSNTNSNKTSPILGGVKSFAKRRNVAKSDTEKALNNETFKRRPIAAVKNITKEERCKRRLFEDEKTSVNSNKTAENIHNQRTNVDSAIRFSPRKSTPENVIYFTEHVPQKDVNKKEQKVKKLSSKDPQLIKYYLQSCKKMAAKELKNIFNLVRNDPLEKAKTSLRITYANTVKERLQKVSRDSVSSNSEIMFEPDSAIARTVKKNAELKTKLVMLNSEYSPYSSRNDEIDDLESEFSAVLSDKLEKSTKRKCASSTRSVHSEREIPISVRAVVDPESANVKMKMDSIDPNRHELIARYLKDIDTSSHQYYKSRSIFNDQRNSSIEPDSYYYQKEKLFISDSNKKTVVFQKSAKHVPAILRKSRNTDNNTERCQNVKETMTKVSMRDLNGENSLVSERTPDCTNAIPNQLLEAPKCKYVFMNAKYNQPPRINAGEHRMHQRNSASEHHSYSSPKTGEGDFVLFQNYGISPIQEQSNIFTNLHNRHKYLFSQESSDQDATRLMRMPSFGEIQERTDCLTLHSSQSQHCSQETVNMHSSQELCNPKPNYCQQCELSNNAIYSNQSCLGCKESYQPEPNFQIIQPENHSFHRSQDLNYPIDNHQFHRNQSSHLQELPMGYNFVQQQSVRQPTKYVAMESKRMPQRHPVYSTNDNHSHARKISMQNQQSSMQPMKYHHSRHIQNQIPCCTISSLHYSDQEPQPTIINTDFDYQNLHQMNNMAVPNPGGSSNYSSEITGLNGRAITYVPSGIADQSFISKQSIPMHTAVNNPRYMGQRMLPSSSSYSQVEYQNNHCNNKDFKVNDVYLQQMNCNVHLKRP